MLAVTPEAGAWQPVYGQHRHNPRFSAIPNEWEESLPEVFLMAIPLVRNLDNPGHRAENFATVNMAFIPHCRPMAHVVNRPTAAKASAL